MDGELEFLSVEVCLSGFELAGLSFSSGFESLGLSVEGSAGTSIASKGTSGVMHFWEDWFSDDSPNKGMGRQDPVTTAAFGAEFALSATVSGSLVSKFTAMVGLFPFSVVFSETFVCISEDSLLSTV